MNEPDLQAILAQGESMTVEFKSDQGPLSDTDLVETAACLANGQGGTLLVGVEDDGRVTGLHPRHRTHPFALAAFVANRTVPPVAVEAEFVHLPEGIVAALRVSAARQPVSTSDGRLLVRYLDTHGRPGCRPLYAYELTNWLSERGQADATALVVPHAAWEDLDPVEFARLRRMVQETPGDSALLALSNEELARALSLVRSEEGRLVPTVAGLLLVGTEAALREHIPAHEVAFQVLQGTDVAVNEFRRWPLLRVHEWLMEAIGVRNEEQELMLGGVRIGVPRYDRQGIREAVNNALIHRDYTRLGAIHVQLHDDHVRVSNPGGFVVHGRPPMSCKSWSRKAGWSARGTGGARCMSCPKRTNKRTLSVYLSVSVRTQIPDVPCRAGWDGERARIRDRARVEARYGKERDFGRSPGRGAAALAG